MGSLFSHPSTFARGELSLEEAEYAFIGVPYDSSESYRVGSRFAPRAIREASMEMEDYDLLEDADLRMLRIADLGDVEVSFGNFHETISRIKEVVGEILNHNVIPVGVGGEHTITYGILSAYRKKPFVVMYDAHMDFRDDYLEEKFSHACVARRVSELVGIENIILAGVRSASKEEAEAAREMGFNYITVTEWGDRIADTLGEAAGGKNVYLSVDMDVFDPSEAKGVCNPEPPGISFNQFVASLEFLKNCNLVGLDVTEVTPLYDSYTPILAAKVIFKVLLRSKKIKKYKSHRR